MKDSSFTGVRNGETLSILNVSVFTVLSIVTLLGYKHTHPFPFLMLYPSLALTASLATTLLGAAPNTTKFPLISSVSQSVIQDSVSPNSSPAPRLSVKPKTDATGKNTPTAGITQLEGYPGYLLYVPEKCVGNKRSPLILLLHGGGRSAKIEVDKFRALADKHGMIILAGNSSSPGYWDIIKEKRRDVSNLGIKVTYAGGDVAILDSALKLVLRTNAIDPDKIALVGFSNGGAYSLFLGRSNLDVFSRIAGLSPIPVFDGQGPANTKTQFFLSGGVGEQGLPYEVVKLAQVLRKQGHPVLTQLGLRGHVDHVHDEDLIWTWLNDSWKNPKITTQEPASMSETVLTSDAVAKLTTFWTKFRNQPDSILNAARIASQTHVPMTLGTERVLVVLMDIPAMAAKYPSIAVELKAAGLTAKEAQAYRTALLSVLFAKVAGVVPGEPRKQTPLGEDIPLAPVKDGSALAKNIEFVNANKETLRQLEADGFWKMQ